MRSETWPTKPLFGDGFALAAGKAKGATAFG